MGPAARLGCRIQGDVGGDFAGSGVSSAGDINGDGFDDLLVGAPSNDSGGTDAGAASGGFGHPGGFGSRIDLTDIVAAGGIKIQGDLANDNAGFSLSSAGDINGDGFADI